MNGEIEILISDDLEGSKHEEFYFLDDKKGKKYELFFKQEKPYLMKGSSVKVKGIKLDDKIALDSGSNPDSFEVLYAVPTGHTIKKVAVILMNFQNNTSKPYTKDQIKSKTFTNSDSVRNYFKEASYDQLILQGKNNVDGDVFGYFTVPRNNYPCALSNLTEWKSLADSQAKGRGVDLSGYDNLIYFFPSSSACPFAGLAYIGGIPGLSWINGAFGNYTTVAHELGHNYGLHHSNGYNCVNSSGVRVSISSNCTSKEYGDEFDVMGLPKGWHTNIFQKGRLNWFTDANTKTVTVSGDYNIYPLEKKADGIVALRVPKDKDSLGNVKKYYYVEYRQPFGFDNFTSTDLIANGATIHVGPDYGTLVKPNLIDAVPGTSTFSDATFQLGKAFVDTTAGIKITPISKGNGALKVTVALTPPVCDLYNPSIWIAPTSQWGNAGAGLNYSVKIMNNNSSFCPPAEFRVAPDLPSGWSQNPSSFTKILASGEVFTQNITVNTTGSTPSGYYTFTEKVFNVAMPGYYKTAAANLNILNKRPAPSNMYPYSGRIFSKGSTASIASSGHYCYDSFIPANEGVTVCGYANDPENDKMQFRVLYRKTSGLYPFDWKVAQNQRGEETWTIPIPNSSDLLYSPVNKFRRFYLTSAKTPGTYEWKLVARDLYGDTYDFLIPSNYAYGSRTVDPAWTFVIQ